MPPAFESTLSQWMALPDSARRERLAPRVGLALEAAGIEPASRRKQNPKQVALLPANALISHWIVPPLLPVSSRLVPFNSPMERHTEGTCGPSQVGN